MDVMRIDSDDEERRFCVCVASYGYMGDLMRQSEKLRFMGPSRYNLAGAATLFKNKVRISIALHYVDCPTLLSVRCSGQRST